VADATVRVKGLKELNAVFRRLEGDVKNTVRDELKEVARPVAEDAKAKIGRYQGASLNTIRPRVTGRSVFITQSARKVTGKRGDYGALQMTRGLMPALDQNTDKIVRGLDHVLDRLGSSAGF
jgi:hypothetical protein